MQRNRSLIAFIVALLICICISILFFNLNSPSEIPDDQMVTSIVTDWYQFALEAERVTEGYRSPISARMYAYAGLAGHETAVPALETNLKSLYQNHKDLHIPGAKSFDYNYYLPAALNGCYSKLFGQFFSTSPEKIKDQLKKLEEKWDIICEKDTDPKSLLNSKNFGAEIALAVYKWSETDTLAHNAYFHLYDPYYSLPEGEGKWVPCRDFPLPPLLPHWSKARTFVIDPKKYLARPHLEYSTHPNSPFYNQALEVDMISSPLSNENLWIAEFWSDDQPGLTFTPAGRWISIANQVVKKEHPTDERVFETYLKLGFAINDAIIACWYSKYYYNLERPESYINNTFDPDWRPVHHTPPFPSYPSGHSMVSAAACQVFTHLYGTIYKFTDKSHLGRKEFKSKPRTFQSFQELADECAFSRIPLGVHFRMDCDEGIRLGNAIGERVALIF